MVGITATALTVNDVRFARAAVAADCTWRAARAPMRHGPKAHWTEPRGGLGPTGGKGPAAAEPPSTVSCKDLRLFSSLPHINRDKGRKMLSRVRPALLRAQCATARMMSSKIITHCVGPDRVGVLSQITRVITAHGGKMHDTRAVTLGGTFSVTAEIELEDDSAGLAFALQTKLPDFITCMRPESETQMAAGVFGRLKVTNAAAMGVISQMTEHVASRGIGFATMRTAEHIEEGSSTPVFSMNATLNSSSEVDHEWLGTKHEFPSNRAGPTRLLLPLVASTCSVSP
jgi:glycine cleavage system regulatory protein